MKIFMRICTYGKSIDFGESIIDYRIIVSSIWKNQKKSEAAAVAILNKRESVTHSLIQTFTFGSE